MKNKVFEMFRHNKKDFQHVVWMCGLPCSGKTFLAKKMAESGWYHIEADSIPKTKKNIEIWNNFCLALIAREKDFVIYEEMWMPYY